MTNFWTGRPVLVTGGASFIGSHLVDALVERDARVLVVDDLSSGRLDNIQQHLDGRVEFRQEDLLDSHVAQRALSSYGGVDICFHLANKHGGRGFVDRNQALCATNLGLDSNVIRAAHGVGAKVVSTSSGCIYPKSLQCAGMDVLLFEDMAGPPYDADNMYGYGKLMAELTLKAFHAERGMRAAIGRLFTVYGERNYESHAITAMIAKAFIDQDPFVIWGDGKQCRNWTHVSDVVRGLLLLGEHVSDATAVNLGTTESTRVIDAVQEVLRYTGKSPKLEFRTDKPTGPANRIAEHALATELLGWRPEVKFREGLHSMIDWYFSTKKVDDVRLLMARES